MTRFKICLGAALVAGLQSSFVTAAPVLIGTGTLSANQDLSGLNTLMESGLAANVFGGIGSGIAYAGGDTFYVLPDRSPNATAYTGGATVDNTQSYISRFHQVELSLASTTGALPFAVSASLKATTLLSSTTALNYAAASASLPSGVPPQNNFDSFYFTGRADNFSGNSTNPNNARLDPEGIRVANDGKSVFVSDEYGPYIYQFNATNGERIKTFNLPASLTAANSRATELAEIADNTTGRTTNKGMEGLAITPDGKTLVGIMQAPLLQDTKKNVRIVTVDIASGATKEFAYKLTDGSGVSEILAINDHEFLVDERDGKGLGDNSAAAVKKLFKIDITGAQSVAGLAGDLSNYAVAKREFLDIKSALVAAGVDAKDIPAKIEGIAFGKDVSLNGNLLHTLWVTNDNDFLSVVTDANHPTGIANPNKFYVFGLSDSDLPNFMSQNISSVPLPPNLALMLSGMGVFAFVLRRKRKHQDGVLVKSA
ncbi:MAG TPA: esterase-like activity of phytase family protein [Cellvibrionaceae bacterium]